MRIYKFVGYPTEEIKVAANPNGICNSRGKIMLNETGVKIFLENVEISKKEIALCEDCRKELCTKLVNTLGFGKYDETIKYILEELYDEQYDNVTNKY